MSLWFIIGQDSFVVNDGNLTQKAVWQGDLLGHVTDISGLALPSSVTVNQCPDDGISFDLYPSVVPCSFSWLHS